MAAILRSVAFCKCCALGEVEPKEKSEGGVVAEHANAHYCEHDQL